MGERMNFEQYKEKIYRELSKRERAMMAIEAQLLRARVWIVSTYVRGKHKLGIHTWYKYENSRSRYCPICINDKLGNK